MRPLKLLALSVVLLAALLLLIAGTYVGVSNGLRAVGMSDFDASGVTGIVCVFAGIGWTVLFAWALLEAVRRFKP